MKIKRINKENQVNFVPKQGELFGFDSVYSDDCVYMCVSDKLDSANGFQGVRMSSPNWREIGVICWCHAEDSTLRPLEQVGELVVKEV
jgi:hypothetical protein